MKKNGNNGQREIVIEKGSLKLKFAIIAHIMQDGNFSNCTSNVVKLLSRALL